MFQPQLGLKAAAAVNRLTTVCATNHKSTNFLPLLMTLRRRVTSTFGRQSSTSNLGASVTSSSTTQ